MGTIITSDKHYKALARKIRAILGTTLQYTPSEIQKAISDLSVLENKYSSIEHGVVFTRNIPKIIGKKLVPGMFARSNITSFTISEDITTLPNNLFKYSELTKITLHDNIISIGEGCFQSCYNLIPTIPKNLVSIGNSAFGWTKINGNLILPDTVTTIGSSAFSGTDLTSIEIPKNVSNIRYSIASYCEYLKAFIIRNSTKVYDIYASASYPYFYNTLINDGNGYIYVPSNLIEQYKVATYWSTYANQFRVLEDYTVDGTVTGAFDYSKI